MNTYLSQKIKILSLVLIILVLYIHSGFHDYPHEILGMPYNHLLQDILSGQIGRCAVPLFYMISGYLFFLHTEQGVSVVFEKMKKRVYTLLIPYIIGCLFFPLFYLGMELIPATARFVNSDSFLGLFQQPFTDILSSLFYKVHGGASPCAFHLWFLRDLILLVAVSPLLYYMRKVMRKEIGVLCLFILSYFQFSQYLPIVPAFWFMAGDAFLARLDKCKLVWTMPLFILFSFVELCWNPMWLNNMGIPVILLGVITIWKLYDLCVSPGFDLKQHKLLLTMCSFTFFIYLFHEPTLNVVRKLLVVLCGDSPWGFAASYLLSPWVFAGVAVMVGMGMKRWMPKVYGGLVGGR